MILEKDIELTGLSDVIFKGIMYTHEKILSMFLNTVYEEELGNFKYLSPEMPVVNFIEKGRRLDLYLEEKEMLINIEVTNNYGVFIKNRNLGFEAKLYIDSVKRGDGYNAYKDVRSLQLIGKLKDKKDKRNYYFKDEEGQILSKKLLYSEVFIDNYANMYYNKDKKAIEKYKYIIMLGLNLRELIKFNSEYGDDIVQEYTESFKEIITSEAFEPLFTKEEDEKRIRYSIAFEAEEKGLAEGLEKGLAEGIEKGLEQGEKAKQLEIAKNLLNQNIDAEIISTSTGLTIEQINELKED